MKRIEDLAHSELLALDEDEIRLLIDRECAEEGIPLAGTMPIEPAKPESLGDLECWTVHDVLFTDEADARAVARAIDTAKSRVSYRFTNGAGYQKIAMQPEGETSVGTVRIFSAAKWAAVGAAVDLYEREKAKYNKARIAYDNEQAKRKSIIERVRTAVELAHEREWARQRRLEEFRRYVDLADGNRAVAWRFLKAARPDAATTLPELREEFEPEVVFEPPPAEQPDEAADDIPI